MKKTMMALALTAVAVAAIAQGGPPQGGFQGGPPQGGQGGFGQRGPGGPGGPGMMGPGNRMPGGPMLLMQPGVQKELNLSQDQIQKIEELARQNGPQGGRGGQGGPPQGGQGGFQGGPPQQRGQGGQGGFQGGPPQGGQGGGQRGPGGPGGPPNGQRGEDMDKKIEAILNDSQFARYQQLSLQAQGARAILRPDVSEKLKLTEEQHDQIRQIMEANRPQGGPQGRGGQGGPPQQGQGGFQGGPPQGGQGGFGQRGQGGPPNFEEMEKKDAELNKKIMAVLTSSQKATWEKMLGKPFKFEKPQMGPGGPGGGPGGGQGGRGGQGGQGGRGGG